MELVPTDELLHSVKDKLFVVSLPRTGTKSICKMVLLLGYKINHCPSIRLSSYFTAEQFECFADTPIYRPSLIKKLALAPSNKFIYIDRDRDQWLTSFENVNLHSAYGDYISRDVNSMKPISVLDRESLAEVFGNFQYSSQMAKDAFHRHRQEVLNSIPSDQLLIYRFQDGWKPLCEFLGKEVPPHAIPHINKNMLFDKIM